MPLPPLAERRPDVPEAVLKIVEQMVAKDPNQRYQTPQEVAEALEPFSVGSQLHRVLDVPLELDPQVASATPQPSPNSISETPTVSHSSLASDKEWDPAPASTWQLRWPLILGGALVTAAALMVWLSLLVFQQEPSEASNPPLDLLAQATVSDASQVLGRWEKVDGELICEREENNWCLFEFDYIPPEEYDIHFEFSLTQGQGEVFWGLPYLEGWVQYSLWTRDYEHFAFHPTENSFPQRTGSTEFYQETNPTYANYGGRIEPNVRYRCRLEVRHDEMRGYVNDRLITTLRRLRDLGNSVVVVEHDEDTIRAADHVIDIGPGAGPRGGSLVAQGRLEEIEEAEHSLTGQYLSGRSKISIPRLRIPPRSPMPSGYDRTIGSGWVTVYGATENNLRNIDVSFPLGCYICVTGVSGSGKSTLVDDILRRALARRFYGSKERPGKHQGLAGIEDIDKVIVIDQSPLGRTPRSNAVTYCGAFTQIRELFSQLPLSRIRGYGAGRFSFNLKGGRCEHCQGDGMIKIEMHFLADVFVQCEVCNGARYNRETLEITYRGHNIANILELTVDDACRFFRNVPGVSDKLDSLANVGLGYLRLGQPATMLSGGEAQRVKLATELARKSSGRTLYILDEPTTGLHFADIENLLAVLLKLRDAGNTLIVIEHNLEMIKCADWVIDLGPEGGSGGGRVLAEGPPETIAACEESHTGRYLQRIL